MRPSCYVCPLHCLPQCVALLCKTPTSKCTACLQAAPAQCSLCQAGATLQGGRCKACTVLVPACNCGPAGRCLSCKNANLFRVDAARNQVSG